MKTEIIIVTPSLNPKHNVSGISSVSKFIIENNERYHYIPFIQGKKDNEGGGALRIERLFKTFFSWVSFLNHHQRCLIHYNLPLDAKSVLRDYFFLWYAKKKKNKIVIHIHGGLYLNKSAKPKVIDMMMQYIFSWNIPFIVLSNNEKDILVKLYNAKKVYVLPNCVDLKDAASVNKKYNNDHIDALFLGRIEPNKGIDYIYEAFGELNRMGFDFTLHFAGKESAKTNYIEKFSNQFGKKFLYEGVVFGDNKKELLRKCNVFVMPSFFEGLPMSLLECMSYGLVPVVTNVGSIGSVVKNGLNGIFVKVKDAHTIVETISRLTREQELIEKLGINAKETIFNEFCSEVYIQKLNKIYDTVKNINDEI